jgi:hypothetical protein
MRIWALMLLTPTLFTSLALLSADEPPNAPPSRTVWQRIREGRNKRPDTGAPLSGFPIPRFLPGPVQG